MSRKSAVLDADDFAWSVDELYAQPYHNVATLEYTDETFSAQDDILENIVDIWEETEELLPASP